VVGVEKRYNLNMPTREGWRKKIEVKYISKIGGILFHLTFLACVTQNEQPLIHESISS
jgi:hypothetical protein